MDFETLKGIAVAKRQEQLDQLAEQQRIETEKRKAEEQRLAKRTELVRLYNTEVRLPFVRLFEKAYYDEHDKSDAPKRKTLDVVLDSGEDEIGRFRVVANIATSKMHTGPSSVAGGFGTSSRQVTQPEFQEADGFTVSYVQERYGQTLGVPTHHALAGEAFVAASEFRSGTADITLSRNWDDDCVAIFEAQLVDMIPAVEATIEMLEAAVRNEALNPVSAASVAAYDQYHSSS